MRLLIVEDNRELADNLRELFEDAGHTVRTVVTGTGALTAAEEGFDLALVDVRLPDVSGTALLPRLKRLMPDAEVVVTTGNADLQSAIEAVQAGAFAYLVKPVDVKELEFTVSRALERVALRTQSRILQDELRNSEQRNRDVVDTVQVLVFGVSASDTVQFANRAAEELTGWTSQELEGRSFAQTLLPSTDHHEHALELRRAHDGMTLEREVDLLSRDGRKLRVQMRWTRSTVAVGELVYGTGLDVTRQRELERAARVSEKLAAVGTLTAGLAHEIRNPLNAALLQLSLAERRIRKTAVASETTITEPLALVRTELARLSSLLEDFLAFARPRDVGPTPIDVGELLRDVVKMESAVARTRGLTLSAEAEPDLQMRGDANTLKGALLNLIRNAMQAARTRVSTTATVEQGGILITISDDGPGIPADVQPHLFEPFFTTKPGGTGLGLAIVHATITAHGGEISITSDAVNGTVARVLLPRMSPAKG